MSAVSSVVVLAVSALVSLGPPASSTPPVRPRADTLRLADVVVLADQQGTLVEAVIRGGVAAVRERGRGTLTPSFTFAATDASLPRGLIRVGRGPVRSISLTDTPTGLVLTLDLSSVGEYTLASTDSSLIIALPGSATPEPLWRLTRVVPPVVAAVAASVAPAPARAKGVAGPSAAQQAAAQRAATATTQAALTARFVAEARVDSLQRLAVTARRLQSVTDAARRDTVQQELAAHAASAARARDSVRAATTTRQAQDSIALHAAHDAVAAERRDADGARARVLAEQDSVQRLLQLVTRVQAAQARQADSLRTALAVALVRVPVPVPFAVDPGLSRTTLPLTAAASRDTMLARLSAADRSPISLRFRNSPIQTVLSAFSARSGRSIISGAGLDGITVTADINEQPWAIALDAILQSQGLVATSLPSGIIRIEAKSTISEAEKVDALETRLFTLSYASPDSLVDAIKSLATKRGSVATDKGANALIATDIPSALERMSVALRQLDRSPKRVSIQARLVYVSRSGMDALGFTYDIKDSRGAGYNDIVPMPGAAGMQGAGGQGAGGQGAGGQGAGGQNQMMLSQPTVGLTQSMVAGVINSAARVASPSLKLLATLAGANSRFTLVSFLEVLRQLDLARLEATPLIVVNDNQTAELVVGEQVPVRVLDAGNAGGGGGGGAGGGAGGLGAPIAVVQFKEVGIILKARPHVTSDGQIMMDVSAENSSASISSPDIGMTIKKQRVDTRVQVADGETLVLGSLTITEKSSSRTGLPFFSSLPYIGRLFSTTTAQNNVRDLVILITPHIVEGR